MLVKNDNWKWYAPWRMHWEMVPIKVKGGAGYTWSNKDLDLMLASCSIGKWVLARPSQAGGELMLVQVPADMPAFTVRVHGKGASPKVDLVGPDGRRIPMSGRRRRARRRLAHDRHQPRRQHDVDHGRQPGGG